MRRICVVLIALLLAAGTLSAQEGISFRNISSLSLDIFLDGAVETNINQVLLLNLTDEFGLEVKIQREDAANFTDSTEPVNESTISAAPVVVWAPGTYTLGRYAFGYDSQRQFAHEVQLDTTHETGEFIATYGARYVIYPARDYWFLVPSMGLSVFPVQDWTVMMKYFGSVNSRDEISSALWGEVTYRLNDLWSFKVGGTGEATGHPSREDRYKGSAIAGVSIGLRQNLRLRLQTEAIWKSHDATGFSNVVVLDATF